MGLFGKLFGKTKSLSAASGTGVLRNFVQEPYTGAWQKNGELTRSVGTSFHAVFACVSLISKDMGKLPITLKKYHGKVLVDAKTPRNLVRVFERPNTYQNWQQFNEHWTTSLLLRGNTYVLKVRDAFGYVMGLRVLNPDLVTTLVSDKGEVFYQLKNDHLSQTESVTVPASEIIHDRINAFYHPLVGLTPISACALAAGTGVTIQGMANSFFSNNSRPAGILTAPGPISPEKAKAVRDAWNSAYSGDNVGKTAMMGDGITYTQIAMTAVDSQLIEQLEMSAKIVCSAFNVPPFKVQIGDYQSGMKISDLNEIYYSDCLQSYIESRENLIDDGLELKSYNIECYMNLDYLIRMDSQSKITYYKDAIGAGILSPNEAREKLGYLPVDGGESPMIQQQNYSLQALAKRDAKDDPFGKESPSKPVNEDSEDEDFEKALETMYKGVFKSNENYLKGSFVTHKGSLWYCKADHSGEFDHKNFKLAVKGAI